jgi:hypothetical protein
MGFESGASLWIMIQKRKVELRGDFDIGIARVDCDVAFPGFSVAASDAADNMIRLLRTVPVN